jgi:hypothetical protein
MPEEVKKTAAIPPSEDGKAKPAADSPRRRSASAGKAALAHITLLDGTILDVHIDVGVP